MIHATCPICAELYETDSVICACPCGHTFHETCLQKWIATSTTCPQCRQKATLRSIVKLFFEHSDESETQVDPSKLQNALDEAKLETSRERKAAATFRQETERLSDLVDTVNERNKKLKKELKEEQAIRDAMRNQLSMFSKEIDEAQKAKKEAKRLREKLQLLERFELVMTGNIEAVEGILRDTGDWSKSSRELATYCIALKKEFESSKATRKQLHEEKDRLKKDNSAKTKMLLETKKDHELKIKTVQSLREELEAMNKDRQKLKDRVQTLEKAVSNTGNRSMVLLQTPTLSGPSGEDKDIDLDDTPPSIPHQFKPHDTIEPSPNTKNRHACEELDIPFVKITSKLKQQQKENKRQEDRATLAAVKKSSLFQSKRPLGDSKITNGFDGFGGHSSFVHSSSLKRASLGTSMGATKRFKKASKAPPALPSLKSFMS